MDAVLWCMPLVHMTHGRYSLLYNPEVSRLAVAAVTTVDDEERLNLTKAALFSPTEENLLRDVEPIHQADAPPLDTFEALLADKVDVFYPTRTPWALRSHWLRLKHFDLLSSEQSCAEDKISEKVKNDFNEYCESLPRTLDAFQEDDTMAPVNHK